jgi:hypothetical protein
MAYFAYFPKIYYDVRGNTKQQQFDAVTNIMARVVIKSNSWKQSDENLNEFVEAANGFEKYVIKDGDRPDTVADQFYGDSELHWVVLYANGASMQQPWYDWPMTQYDLTKFVAKKYGSGNLNATNHYSSGGFQVDSDAAGATIVTNFGHEQTLNDAKRPIRVIGSQYVSLVVDEFKSLMSSH